MKIKISTLSVLLGIACAATSVNANLVQYTPENLYPELQRVIKKAEANALELEQARYTKSKAILTREIAHTNKRPTVSFGTGLGLSGDSENDDMNIGPNDLRLSMSYTLYQWGAKKAGHRKADLQYQRFEREFEDKLSVFGKNIRNEFLTLIIEKFRLNVWELELSILQETIAQDTLNHEEGRLSKENYERILNSRKIRMLDINNGKRAVERRIENFRVLTGVKDFGWDNIPSNIPQISDVSSQVQEVANRVRSDKYASISNVYKSNIGIDIADESIIQSKSSFRPRVGLSASTSMSPEFSQNNDLVMKYRAGLNVNWTIYNAGRFDRQLQSTYLDRRIQMAANRNALEMAEQGIERLLEDLDYQFNRMEIKESEYEMALSIYDKSKEEYSRGRVSDIQFMHVEVNRLQEELSIYETRKQYITNLTNLLSYIGEDPILDILTLPEMNEAVTLED